MLIHSKELLMTEPTYTLTVTTNPSYANCILTVNGISYPTKTLSNLKKGTVVSYRVWYMYYDGSGTAQSVEKTGSVTVNSNKTLNFTLQTTATYSLDSDITTYGSPTITSDGIISGLSTSNRLQYNTNNMSASEWEVNLPFKCTGATSTYQCLIGIGPNSASSYGCRILIDSSGKLLVTSYNGSLIKLTENQISVTDGQWHVVNVSFSSSYLKGLFGVGKSLVPNQYYTFYNERITTNTSWNSKQFMGCQVYASSSTTWSRRYPATNCSVDLVGFYIKTGSTNYISNATYSYNWNVSTTDS